MHYDKYEFVKILIQLVAVFNLFTLEVLQKCQLCVLRENLFGRFLLNYDTEIPKFSFHRSK